MRSVAAPRPLPVVAITLAAAVALLAALVPTRADAADGFRVAPYLTNPSSDGMTITWFTDTATPGQLTVRGRGLPGGRTYTTQPTDEPTLDYTDAELAQEIPGLEQGSWLRGPRAYKHTVDVTGLHPDSRYTYTVRVGAARFTSHFTTAVTADRWRSIRFVALSDSETEPAGRVTHREWAPSPLAPGSEPRPGPDSAWADTFGTATLNGVEVLRYALTEDEGFAANVATIESRRPDFVMMPGDLVQGGGYQPGWDEFFRYGAGEVDDLFTHTPLLPALGNWETFGALNGGYGTPEDRSPVVRSRAKYHVYFDGPPNGTPAHRDNYYRIDYGPITVITLDSTNGEPDDHPDSYAPEEKATGREYRGPGTDTQSNFTRAEYEAAGGTDLSDYNPGSIQWSWAEEQLADARAAGQVIFVQFHHAPYSSGEHGLPMDHVDTSGQGGTPMRQYQQLFAKYGVAAVLSGHSEMFERSVVDSDGGEVVYFDVGIAGDGLRGERRTGPGFDSALLRYNDFRVWTADQDAAERWETIAGTRQLVAGGKHYGHLEVNVTNLQRSRVRPLPPDAPHVAVTLTPVHVFPVLDADYELVRTERRVYDDEVTLYLDAAGRVISMG